MKTTFNKQDRKFLKLVGIKLPPEQLQLPFEDTSVHVARPDGTCRLLQEMGIPVTRENYLMLAFAGKPPKEPLDGEIEAELPEELQMYETSPTFDAAEMLRRSERLKAEGRMPPLADLLAIMERASEQSPRECLQEFFDDDK